MSQESGENGYGVVFREYVRRSVRRALADARAAEAGLPAEQREQALQTLTFALDATDAWPEARDLLVALAPKLDQAGWREEVVPYLLRGIEVSESTGDDARSRRVAPATGDGAHGDGQARRGVWRTDRQCGGF